MQSLLNLGKPARSKAGFFFPLQSTLPIVAAVCYTRLG